MHGTKYGVAPRTAAEGKRKIVSLDGMRGVAAFAVMLFHGRNVFGGQRLFPHAYMAVDFFFLLSGFVVAYSYADKLRHGLSFRDFMWLRAERLYPLIVLGAALGGGFFVIQKLTHFGHPLDHLYILIVLAALSLPSLYGGEIAPINQPGWSLIFEFAANIIYGLAARFLTWSALIAIIVASGFTLLWQAIAHGDIGVGVNSPELLGGLARVLFPFFGGVLIFRLYNVGRLPRLEIHPAILAMVLLGAFMVPPFAHGWLFGMLVVTFLYPAILVSSLHFIGNTSEVRALEWSGRISYPIYILHYPVFVWVNAVLIHSPRAISSHPWIGLVVGSGLSIALSVASLRFYDEPLRAKLRTWRAAHQRAARTLLKIA